MNKNFTKPLLQRFSCSIVGHGKKMSGYKILLESLFNLRENSNLFVLYKNDLKEKPLIAKDTFRQIKDLHITTSGAPKTTLPDTILAHPFFDFIFCVNNKKTPLASPPTKTSKLSSLAGKFIYRISKKFALKGKSNQSFCVDCISVVKPILETRKLRKGRMTYRVPKITPPQRQESKAISLLLEQANSYSSPLQIKDLSGFSIRTVQSDGKPENLSLSSTLEKAPNFNATFVDPQKKIKSNFLTFPSAYTSFDYKQQQEKRIQLVDKNIFLTNSLPKVIELVSRAPKKMGLNIEGTHENSVFVSTFIDKKTQNDFLEKTTYQDGPQKEDTENYFIKSSVFLKKNNDSLKERNRKSIKNCLSLAFFDSAHGKGESIEKKKQLHKFALQNRAYLHFRWW